MLLLFPPHSPSFFPPQFETIAKPSFAGRPGRGGLWWRLCHALTWGWPAVLTSSGLPSTFALTWEGARSKAWWWRLMQAKPLQRAAMLEEGLVLKHKQPNLPYGGR